MAVQQEAYVIALWYRLSFGTPLSAQAFDVLWIEPMNMEHVELGAAH
jgi:hypothetical protein